MLQTIRELLGNFTLSGEWSPCQCRLCLLSTQIQARAITHGTQLHFGLISCRYAIGVKRSHGHSVSKSLLTCKL